MNASAEEHRFEAAPWSSALLLISMMTTALLLGVGYLAYRAIPHTGGFTEMVGFAVALAPPAVAALALLYVVRAYVVEGPTLYVKRLLWSTRVPLDGLRRVWHDPTACKGSLRVVGNGGLFSFTGLFYNKRLGRYRMYANDFDHAVVLELSGRNVVITPASPEEFVSHVRRRFAIS